MKGNAVSQAIVKRRKELNITQEKLAEKSNLSINYISRIERGSSTNISANSLYKISKALNVPMELLMGKVNSSTKLPGPNQAKLNSYLAKLDLVKSEKLSEQIIDLITNYK